MEKQAEKKRKEKEKEEKQKEKQRLKEELKKEEEEILAKKKTNQVSAPTRKQIQEYEQERIEQLKKEKEVEMYIGEYKDGLRHGKGTLYYLNGDIKYEGDFVNDKFEGNGKGYWEDGEYLIFPFL